MSRVFKDALLDMGHEVTYLQVETLQMTRSHEFRYPYIYQANDYDYIFVGQTHINFEIRRNNSAPIIYIQTEYTWYPGCWNPEFILMTHPEIIEKMCFENPQHLFYKKDQLWFGGMWREKDITDHHIDTKNYGIYYMGYTNSNDHSYGRQRSIYNERAEIVGRLQHKRLIFVRSANYTPSYFKIMGKWDAGLVMDGTDAYFSPKAIEYAAHNVIPIIWVGDDMLKVKYYTKMGYEHMVNCYFAFCDKDIEEFYTLSNSTKKKLRAGCKEFVKKFEAKKLLPEIFDWIKMVKEVWVG